MLPVIGMSSWKTMTIHKTQATHWFSRHFVPGLPESKARRIRHLIYLITLITVIILLLAWPPAASARNISTLDAIDFSILPGNRFASGTLDGTKNLLIFKLIPHLPPTTYHSSRLTPHASRITDHTSRITHHAWSIIPTQLIHD